MGDAAGGVLMEWNNGRLTDGYGDDRRADTLASSGSHDERLLDGTLARLAPTRTSSDEVERMKLGYDFTGQLDLRATFTSTVMDAIAERRPLHPDVKYGVRK